MACLINEKVRRKEHGLIVTPIRLKFQLPSQGGEAKPEIFISVENQSRGKSRSKSITRKEIIGYNCGNVGHIKMDCRVLKREYSREKYYGNENKNDKDTTTVARDNDVHIVYDDSYINLAYQGSTRLLTQVPRTM